MTTVDTEDRRLRDFTTGLGIGEGAMTCAADIVLDSVIVYVKDGYRWTMLLGTKAKRDVWGWRTAKRNERESEETGAVGQTKRLMPFMSRGRMLHARGQSVGCEGKREQCSKRKREVDGVIRQLGEDEQAENRRKGTYG